MQEENELTYCVVVNELGQYSIWLELKPVPAGWRAAGFSGSKEACLQHIDATWLDIRPLPLRQAAQEAPAVTGASKILAS